jgi:hypothetical protein
MLSRVLARAFWYYRYWYPPISLFGDIVRNLVGLCDLLDSTSQPMDELRVFIIFPNQSPHRILEIRRHIFWSQLATVLEKPEYSGLRHLTVCKQALDTATCHYTKRSNN